MSSLIEASSCFHSFGLRRIEMSNLINFVHSELDFSRFVSRFRNCDSLAHLQASILDLASVKDRLIRELAQSKFVSHPVSGGLGAICISCVERFVTPVLLKHGFQTKVILRDCRSRDPFTRNLPSVHCYNSLEIEGEELIVDLDADPFAGKNTGVVVVPATSQVYPYCDGVVMHERTCLLDGSISNYWFSDEEHPQERRYLEGSQALSISLLNYLDGSDDLCPLVLRCGVQVLFGIMRFRIRDSNLTRFPLRIIFRCNAKSNDLGLQLCFRDVKAVSILPDTDRREVISVTFENERVLRLVVYGNGCLLESDSVRFSSTTGIHDEAGTTISGNFTLPLFVPVGSS